MICTNYIYINEYVSNCIVLSKLGIKNIPSDGRSNNICDKCKSEWNSPFSPTIENLTPTMVEYINNKKISLPTITEQAVSVGKSLVEWAFNGFQNVPQHEAERRLNICKSNQCGMYNEDSGRCSACGCFCAAKVQFSHEECPAGYWGKKDLGAEVLNNAPPNRCGSCGNR